jgi:purine-binding chemotaxis protein CheW
MAAILRATGQNKATLDKEGKYLSFALAHEEYGLEILKVREIIGYMDVTAVPQTPHFVKGVINLRGQVIPVVDLRAKFGMEVVAITDQTCIIVVEIDHSRRKSSTGIIGMAKVGESVKILLDIDKVLGGDAMDDLGFAGDPGNDQV